MLVRTDLPPIDVRGPKAPPLIGPLGGEHSKPIRASCTELEIFEPEGGAPLAAQLDGEEWPARPKVRIDVVARALRLIVPGDLP